MIEQAKLVRISGRDVPTNVYAAFMDSVELNGNPFFHQWKMFDYDKWIPNAEAVNNRKVKVDNWLKDQGLTKDDIIIITGGW